MAGDKKITELTTLATGAVQGDDLAVMVDVHDSTMDPAGTDKQVAFADIVTAMMRLNLLTYDDGTYTYSISQSGATLDIKITRDADGLPVGWLSLDGSLAQTFFLAAGATTETANNVMQCAVPLATCYVQMQASDGSGTPDGTQFGFTAIQAGDAWFGNMLETFRSDIHRKQLFMNTGLVGPNVPGPVFDMQAVPFAAGTVPAPTAGLGAVFFQINGGGKMELLARFPTGAAQVIATEP